MPSFTFTSPFTFASSCSGWPLLWTCVPWWIVILLWQNRRSLPFSSLWCSTFSLTWLHLEAGSSFAFRTTKCVCKSDLTLPYLCITFACKTDVFPLIFCFKNVTYWLPCTSALEVVISLQTERGIDLCVGESANTADALLTQGPLLLLFVFCHLAPGAPDWECSSPSRQCQAMLVILWLSNVLSCSLPSHSTKQCCG